MTQPDKEDGKPLPPAIELDGEALDIVTGGARPASVWKDGNVTGDDDWEKHNV